MNQRVMGTIMAERLLSDEEAAAILAGNRERVCQELIGVDIHQINVKGQTCILISPSSGSHCLIYPVDLQSYFCEKE